MLPHIFYLRLLSFLVIKINSVGVNQLTQTIISYDDGHISLKHVRVSTDVEQAVACAPVTQQARVRSPVGTSFLGEVFS